MIAATCPSCGTPNEVHERGTGDLPVDGDASLCWTCREPAVFVAVPGGGLGLRAPTEEERAAITGNPEWRAALTAVLESRTPRQAVALFGHVRGGS